MQIIENQGEKFKALRKKIGLTQIDLAEKVNLSIESIKRYENMDIIPMKNLKMICNVMEWDFSIFYEVKENKEYNYTTDTTATASEPTAVYHKENDINFILKELISIKNMLFEINKKLDK